MHGRCKVYLIVRIRDTIKVQPFVIFDSWERALLSFAHQRLTCVSYSTTKTLSHSSTLSPNNPTLIVSIKSIKCPFLDVTSIHHSNQNPESRKHKTHKTCNNMSSNTASSSDLFVLCRRPRPVCQDCYCLLKWCFEQKNYWCSGCKIYVKRCDCCGGLKADWSASR